MFLNPLGFVGRAVLGPIDTEEVMRTRTIYFTLLAGLAAAASLGPGVGASAQPGKTTHVTGLEPGLPVTVSDLGPSAMKLTVGGGGDLDLALDPSKPYRVYRRDCTRYEIVVESSEADNNCRKAMGDKARQPGQKCGSCVLAGAIFNGTYTANPVVQAATSGGGSHMKRNAGIGAAGAAAIGTIFAVNGGDSPPASSTGPAPLTTFANTTWQGTLIKTSDSCGTFASPGVIQVVISTANSDGTISVSTVHIGATANTPFPGTGRLVLQSDGTITIATDAAVTGTLRSTGDGRFNTARNQLTSYTNRVDRVDGSCGAVYGGGSGVMNKVG